MRHVVVADEGDATVASSMFVMISGRRVPDVGCGETQPALPALHRVRQRSCFLDARHDAR